MYVQKILLTELIRSAAADGAYDIRRCHNELRCKKIRALTHPRKGAGYNWKAKFGGMEASDIKKMKDLGMKTGASNRCLLISALNAGHLKTSSKSGCMNEVFEVRVNMKTLLTLRCINQRGAGHLKEKWSLHD